MKCPQNRDGADSVERRSKSDRRRTPSSGGETLRDRGCRGDPSESSSSNHASLLSTRQISRISRRRPVKLDARMSTAKLEGEVRPPLPRLRDWRRESTPPAIFPHYFRKNGGETKHSQQTACRQASRGSPMRGIVRSHVAPQRACRSPSVEIYIDLRPFSWNPEPLAGNAVHRAHSISSSRSHSVSQTRRPIAASSTERLAPRRWTLA